MGLLENLSAWWNERKRRNVRMKSIQRRLTAIGCQVSYVFERRMVSNGDMVTGTWVKISKECSVCGCELHWIRQLEPDVITTLTGAVQPIDRSVRWINPVSQDRWDGSWCFICDTHLEDRIIEEEVKILPIAVLKQQIAATQKLQAEVLAAHAAKMQRLDVEVAAKTARLHELEGTNQFPQGGYRGVPVSTVNAS